MNIVPNKQVYKSKQVVLLPTQIQFEMKVLTVKNGSAETPDLHFFRLSFFFFYSQDHKQQRQSPLSVNATESEKSPVSNLIFN